VAALFVMPLLVWGKRRLRRPPTIEQWRQTQCSPQPALTWLP
jgi:hypothetical protein